MNWLWSLPLRKPVPGRTRDSAGRNRKFNMPTVWYSVDHLHAWIEFLRARYNEGLITYHKFREKVRSAHRACERQRREVGHLPAEHSGRDYSEEIVRELQRKAANGY
jgi:hypothetical protein